MKRRKRKRGKTVGGGRAPKRGTPYEQVVADVMRAMDPGATVTQGEWVVGPDGRRDRDVFVVGSVGARFVQVLIECKDYDPNSTGPVGIEKIDALESKRRDLPCDVAVLCSNAGFTSDAVRKAARVGIGLIGILRAGDKRLRFAVEDEIYFRRLKVDTLNYTVDLVDPTQQALVTAERLTYQGLPIENWVIAKVATLIGTHPIVRGCYKGSYRFIAPLRLGEPPSQLVVTKVSFSFNLTGGWFAQRVAIDATNGIYDWLRRRTRRASGPGRLEYRGVNLDEGEPIAQQPKLEYLHELGLIPGEVVTMWLLLEGLEIRDPVPLLDPLILPEDLDEKLSDLPPEATSSGPPV